jgi:phospholipid/cholesterol/gamma-HCH transport system ATP-binding protein
MVEPVISVRGLRTRFGRQVIHDGLDLDVLRGEVLGVVGGSGAGTSTVLGRRIDQLDATAWAELQSRWGVLFQNGALFSSLTVEENIEVPLKEHLKLPRPLMREVAALKIQLVGLPADAAAKYPSQLSGGMRKRAGLARALALDPEILFLDEPTSGLDPIGAAAFDELIGSLQRSLGLTVFMVTHDLDSLRAICDRIAVLVDKRVTVGTLDELMRSEHPWIHEYFHGPRARAVQAA